MVSALPSTSSPEYTVPAAYALQWVELASRWKIPKDELLSDLGLDPRALEEPSARLPLETMNALVSLTRKLTGEPGLGFYFGLEKRISMYGYLGFAMMSAATMREVHRARGSVHPDPDGGSLTAPQRTRRRGRADRRSECRHGRRGRHRHHRARRRNRSDSAPCSLDGR